MFSIYTNTNDPWHGEFWRYLVSRKLLGRHRGPDAVRDSVARGFASHAIPFRLNPYRPFGKTALVLSGIEALRTAIRYKQEGRFERLLAGPNIVAHPGEAAGLLGHSAINTILVPSGWVADLWKNEAPALSARIRIWPAGVEAAAASSRSGAPIIYDKMGDLALLTMIQQDIGTHRLFTYGTFQRDEYLSALRDAPYMVYLSPSESQGLALQEAWAYDVPTLVNKSSYWNNGTSSWEAPQINCPYLTPEVGAVFEDPRQVPAMAAALSVLHPKPYCDEHLSDEASVRILLTL